jgi:MYXO-CTERM domain-containing protein
MNPFRRALRGRAVLPALVLWVLGVEVAQGKEPVPSLDGPQKHAGRLYDAFGREILGPEKGRQSYDDSRDPALQGRPTPGVEPSRQSLSGIAPAGQQGSPSPQPLTSSGMIVQQEWHRATMGWGIGLAGLHAVDLDGNGSTEVVATSVAGSSWWYVLARDGAGYSQTWTSPLYSSPISALRVAQVDGDAPLEVLVGSGSQVLIYDGATRELQQTIATPTSSLGSLSVGDVDADGAQELVFCDTGNLYVLELASGTTEYQGAGLGCQAAAVGQVDGDAALEIVLANGTSAGLVVDGASHAVEWTNQAGFGNMVRTGDLNGDGRAEIIAGYAWNTGIRVFDAGTRTELWSVSIFNLAVMQVADVEGDGPLEIVYGDAQWGSVHALNGATGAQKWAVSNPEHGVTNVAVGDVDGDSVREVLWGAGYTSTGPDYLYVASTTTRATEWRSTDLGGPFRALSYGDVDADGAPELLSGSFESDSGYGDGAYAIHDAATHALEYQNNRTTGINWTGLWRIRSANVDSDPQREIFLTTSSTYDALIICYDALSHAEQWRTAAVDSVSFRSMDVADVDGDGALEVVAAASAETTGAEGQYVYVFDAATGAQKWRSPQLGAAWSWRNISLLRVAQVDADPALEIVVAETGGQLWVVDPVARTVQLTTASLNVTALDTPDRDGNGQAELVIGTTAGALQAVDADSGVVVQTVGSFGSSINGLAVRDVTGDGVADYVFASGNRLRIFNGATSSEEWASSVIGSGVGIDDSVLVGDVDRDGNTELVVNVGQTGFRVFEVHTGTSAPPAPVLTAPAALVNTAQPVIRGTALPETTVTVLVDGVAVGTTQVSTSGFWSLTPIAPLAQGAHTATATAANANGVTSPPSQPRSFTVDSVAPSAPVITAPALFTATATPTIAGTAEVGSTVSVRVDGQAVGVMTADATGAWSFDVVASLAQGAHQVTATAKDAAGNTSPGSSLTFTVDMEAPAAPVVTAPGVLVNTQTPAVAGRAEAGSRVAVSLDGQAAGEVTADATGAWSFTLSTPLAQGAHQATATATDMAGNTSAPSAARSFTVDSVAPASPVLTAPAEVIITPLPFIAGTTEVGTTVVVWLDGQAAGSATVNAAGRWSFIPASPLAEGVHSVTATALDTAGNESAPSVARSITVDTVSPAAPVVVSPADGDKVGTVQLTFSGTAEAGSMVVVTVDGTNMGQTPADAAGGWSLTSPYALAPGMYTVTATALDSAGNVSPAADGNTFTVGEQRDTVPPAAPVVVSPADGDMVGTVRLTFSGTAEAGSMVVVTVDGTNMGQTPADAAGGWSFTSPYALAPGMHTVTATALDSAGNVSPASDGNTFTVGEQRDTVPPAAPVVVSPADGDKVGTVQLAFSGTAEAGSMVVVTVDGTNMGQTPADAAGGWSFTSPYALAPGMHTVTATALDSAGNVSPASDGNTFTVEEQSGCGCSSSSSGGAAGLLALLAWSVARRRRPHSS